MFIGGVPPLVDQETFQKYFGKFGKMLECRVVLDKYSLKSRGFGFVTYSDMKVAEKVMSQRLKLFGKEIECKSALSKT